MMHNTKSSRLSNLIRLLLLIISLSVVIQACATISPSPTDAVQVPIKTTPPTKVPTVSPQATTPIIISPTITTSPTKKSGAKSTAIIQKSNPASKNPLTGLEVNDPILLERRPISIKVQVFPRGQRPPWGISLADIVFDYYQNNGVTRFNAIFYGNDSEKVGPIRSARLLDAHLIKMYKAIFIFGSADWRILERLRGGDFSDRIIMEKWGICPPLCRIDPEGYNYLMVNTKELSEFVDDNKIRDERQNLDGMSFNPSPPETSLSGQQAFVRISYAAYNRWDYDETSQRYLRFQDMIEALAGEEELAPMLDGINNEQISAANVVILLTTYKYAYQSKAGANEVFDIRLNGISGLMELERL
jgi:hypothetical protein